MRKLSAEDLRQIEAGLLDSIELGQERPDLMDEADLAQARTDLERCSALLDELE